MTEKNKIRLTVEIVPNLGYNINRLKESETNTHS